MRILIAEDERRAMRGLKNLITSISEEYEVVAEASNGRQALELIQIVKPDVVFTDLKMPYMDGMSLIKAAQAAGISAQYVIVTAYEEFEAAREAIVLGVKDYLVKPITYDEVAELMKRLEKKGGDRGRKEELGKLKERYPDAHPLVIKCLNFIERGYGSKINQKELAESLGVSQEYLCYLFNKNIGETFSKFVKNYRIETAKKLLLNGYPKEELPYHVGFSDPKYFNKVFREIAGMSVSDFLEENNR
ncbi:MAG TPA: response regulator [Candidatus Blautia merdipullorum]|nr:response regulator [Candidatus Blautia merdipullorum]